MNRLELKQIVETIQKFVIGFSIALWLCVMCLMLLCLIVNFLTHYFVDQILIFSVQNFKWTVKFIYVLVHQRTKAEQSILKCFINHQNSNNHGWKNTQIDIFLLIFCFVIYYYYFFDCVSRWKKKSEIWNVQSQKLKKNDFFFRLRSFEKKYFKKRRNAENEKKKTGKSQSTCYQA